MEAIRNHPYISVIMMTCTVLGAFAGALYMDPSWTMMHRLMGGSVAGAGVGLIIVAPRMVGPWF